MLAIESNHPSVAPLRCDNKELSTLQTVLTICNMLPDVIPALTEFTPYCTTYTYYGARGLFIRVSTDISQPLLEEHILF